LEMVQENVVAKEIVDAAFKIHTKLGPGLLASAYERVFAYELEKARIRGCPAGAHTDRL